MRVRVFYWRLHRGGGENPSGRWHRNHGFIPDETRSTAEVDVADLDERALLDAVRERTGDEVVELDGFHVHEFEEFTAGTRSPYPALRCVAREDGREPCGYGIPASEVSS